MIDLAFERLSLGDMEHLIGASPFAGEWHDNVIVVPSPSNLHSSPTCRVDSFVKIEPGELFVIGDYVHIASFCHLGIGGGAVILEHGSSFGSGSRIVSGSNVMGRGHGCSAVDPSGIKRKSFVHIRRNATLYVGATVLPGVTVGENAVIAAGSVVNHDVPAFEVWGGVPAHKIGVVP